MASTCASAVRKASPKASKDSRASKSKTTKATVSAAASCDTKRGTAPSCRDHHRTRNESPPRASSKHERICSDEREGNSLSLILGAHASIATLRTRRSSFLVESASTVYRSHVLVTLAIIVGNTIQASHRHRHRARTRARPRTRRVSADPVYLSKTMEKKDPFSKSMNDSVPSISNTSSKYTTGPSIPDTSSSWVRLTPMVT